MRRALYLHRYYDPAVAFVANYMEIKCPISSLFRWLYRYTCVICCVNLGGDNVM